MARNPEKLLKAVERAKKSLRELDKVCYNNGCRLSVSKAEGSSIQYIEVQGTQADNFNFYKCIAIVLK